LAEHGPSLLATFVLIPRLEIIELIALAGFDVVVIDLEHGPYGIESISPLVAAAHARELLCVVRVARLESHSIGAALDCGADGVLVPHVSSGADAALAVQAARLAPEGQRGANPYVRAAGYSADGSFLTTANDSAACLALVEGRAGVAAIDEILSVPGLDGIFLGPVDLSADVGVPGETEHPLVLEAFQRVIDACQARGVATSAFAATPQAARRWIEIGVGMVTVSVDTALILQGFRAAIADLRAEDVQSPRSRSTVDASLPVPSNSPLVAR